MNLDKYQIRYSRKEHTCSLCQKIIPCKTKYFIRIFKGDTNSYIIKKYHLDCAKKIQLSSKEQELIETVTEKNSNERSLNDEIRRFLQKLENEYKLTYLKVTVGQFKDNQGNIKSIGRSGFSDYIIFLKNSITLFIELKKKSEQNKAQIDFAKKVRQLGFKYHIVTSCKQLYYILYNIYNIINTTT